MPEAALSFCQQPYWSDVCLYDSNMPAEIPAYVPGFESGKSVEIYGDYQLSQVRLQNGGAQAVTFFKNQGCQGRKSVSFFEWYRTVSRDPAIEGDYHFLMQPRSISIAAGTRLVKTKANGGVDEYTAWTEPLCIDFNGTEDYSWDKYYSPSRMVSFHIEDIIREPEIQVCPEPPVDEGNVAEEGVAGDDN